jgi:hypothetical protein
MRLRARESQPCKHNDTMCCVLFVSTESDYLWNVDDFNISKGRANVKTIEKNESSCKQLILILILPGFRAVYCSIKAVSA